jgi:hypothetical protein
MNKSLDITYLKRVRRLFNSDMVSRETNRHNQRAWVRSVRALGPNWLLAAPINAPKGPEREATRAPMFDPPPKRTLMEEVAEEYNRDNHVEAEFAEFRKALAEIMWGGKHG